MMGRSIRVLLTLLLCFVLSSCSRLPTLVIINNSGAPIVVFSVVSTDPEGFDREALGWREGFRVMHGVRTNLLTSDAGGAWRVQFKVGACRLWYTIPNTPEARAAMYGDTIAQLQPEFIFYLVAERDDEPESYRHVKAEGFPLGPDRSQCDGYQTAA